MSTPPPIGPSCFLVEHIAEAADPWVDGSWATAHADESEHVYPDFPDRALDDWAVAYHEGKYPGLAAVKNADDPHGTDSSTSPSYLINSEGET